MHNSPNSPEKNLRFKIAFTETNIRWLLGCNPIDRKLVDAQKANALKAKQELRELLTSTTTIH